MTHRCISSESPSEWNDALRGIPHSFAHTAENARAMKLTTGFETFLYIFESNGAKIICPVSEREFNGHKDIVTPYGFSGFTGTGTAKEFLSSWNDFVRERQYVCGYICMNPLFASEEYYRKEDAVYSTDIYFLDLQRGLTALYEDLDSNRKKLIKNYRKYESAFVYDRDALTEFFVNNYYGFLERIGASEANYFSEDTLRSICSLENVFMAGTGNGGKLEAVYIFSHTKYCADCMFNVATPEGREFAPLLLWCGVKHYLKKKIPYMNLGGGLRNDDSISHSKQRFGAIRKPLMNLRQVYDKKVYMQLCEETMNDPSDNSGYFPAYRRKSKK